MHAVFLCNCIINFLLLCYLPTYFKAPTHDYFSYKTPIGTTMYLDIYFQYKLSNNRPLKKIKLSKKIFKAPDNRVIFEPFS